MILNYTTELKNRFILITITWFSTFCICYAYKENIIFLLINPCLYLFENNFIYFISTNLTEIFYSNIKLSIFISLQVTTLYGLYNTFSFLAPGLYHEEYIKLIYIILFNMLIILINILALYCFLLPKSWEFFISFQQTLNNNIKIYLETNLYDYIIFCITLYKLTIINSQILILILMYTINTKNNINFIKTFRKSLYFCIVLLSSIVTPPDIINQLLLSVSTICIYESVIFFTCIRNKYLIR